MINQLQIQSCSWIDVQSPTKEEVLELHRQFNLDSYISEELPISLERSKVRFFPDYTYVVFHFSTQDETNSNSKKQEIDFIIGKNFLISVRFEEVPSVSTVARDSLVTPELFNTPEALFFHIVFKQYRAIGKNLEKIDTLLDEVEREIFSPTQQKGTVEKISSIHHKILNHKKALRFHADIWKQLIENKNNKLFLSAKTEYLKLWNAVEHYQELLHTLQSSNDSLISFRTNEVMKILTLLTFIALPIAIIPQMINSNITLDPISMFLLIFSISFAIYLGFKKKKWL